LSEEDIEILVRRAIADKERGFGELNLQVDDDAIKHWATISDGDARRALMALEIAVLSMTAERVRGSGFGVQGKSEETSSLNPEPRTLNPIQITLDIAEQSIQQKAIVYDGTGDEHTTPHQPSSRACGASDPDAAIYWLARMLEAGEDRGSSHGGSPSSPAKTSATPTRGRSSSPRRRSISSRRSACPRRASRSPRRHLHGHRAQE